MKDVYTIRCFQTIQARLGKSFSYQHVYGHHDEVHGRLQLTLAERLNCYCDNLAKGQVALVPPGPAKELSQTLPHEHAAVFIQGITQVQNVGDSLRWVMGKRAAATIYHLLGWATTALQDVDWEGRQHAL